MTSNKSESKNMSEYFSSNIYLDEIIPKNDTNGKGPLFHYRLSAFKEFRQINQPCRKKKSNHGNIYGTFKNFCKNNTLHGLPYIGENSLTIGERIFWTTATVLSLFAAIFSILGIYQFHSNVPIIQSLDPLPTNIEKYPFPAITICSKFSISEKKAKEILSEKNPDEINILNYLCFGKICGNSLNISEARISSWENAKTYVDKFVVPCERWLTDCYFGDEPNLCQRIFKPITSKSGSCCTFNKIPENFLYRYEQPKNSNFTYPSNVLNWKLQNGYPEDSSKFIWPWRPNKGDGLNSGLAVVIDASKIPSYCDRKYGRVKLTFFVHKPSDEPEVVQPRTVEFGYETAVEITPKLIEADATIRAVSPHKRGCYFDDERKLLLYRSYSTINCRHECAANFSILNCGCVPFLYPQRKEWKTCDPGELCCIMKIIDSSYSLNRDNGRDKCNCLSECTSMQYNINKSFGTLIPRPIGDKLSKHYSLEYIQKNVAIINFFFKSRTFIKSKKQAMYTFSQHLSNVGGLLALFLGFSFFTAAEIIYYAILKTVIYVGKVIKSKKKKVNTF